MPFFGFTSFKDMFDGGGRGGSGSEHSTKNHSQYKADYEATHGVSDPNAKVHKDTVKSGTATQSNNKNKVDLSQYDFKNPVIAEATVGTNTPIGTVKVIYDVVLSRFSSGLFRAIFAMKEIWNGKEIHRRVSP